MRTFLRKIFLSAAALLLTTAVHAYDFSVVNEDGVTIYYNLVSPTDKTCEVTFIDPNDEGVITINGFPINFYSGDIDIPEKVSYSSVEFQVVGIGNNAFRECYGLTSVTLPNSITYIGRCAFMYCPITSIDLPENLTSIGEFAFFHSDLTSIVIPNSVTSINIGIFQECYKLSSVTLPNGITSIPSYMFSGFYSLTSLKIPESVTEIGDEAFMGCINLETLDIPDGVTSIGCNAFKGCRKLASLPLPKSLSQIGAGAFDSCESLKSMNIPEGVSTISHETFYGCSSLESVSLPKSLKTIEYHAFEKCSSLTSLTIPDSVESIGDAAFMMCKNLISVKLPCPLTCVENSLFGECTSLASIEIPEGVTTIKSAAFYLCSGLKSALLPNSLTTIEGNSFDGCSSLESIAIPNNVTVIAIEAFARCRSLTSLTIGKSVQQIQTKAFSDCSALTKIVSRIEKPFAISGDCFSNMAKMMAKLYVPKGTKPEYQAMDGWSDFLNIDDGVAYYQLTLTAGHGGTIIYGESRVKEGASYTFYVLEGGSASLTIEADEHRELASLTMNGKDVTGSMEGNVFTVAGMDKDVEIVATFRGDANTEAIVLQSNIQTFCSNKNLDFSSCDGLEAYIVSGFNAAINEVILTLVKDVPAGTGLVLKGEAGKEYIVNGSVSETQFVYSNLLVGTLSETSISNSYALKDGAFERIDAPTTINANSAYLVLPESAQSAATLTIRFSKESTGIDLVKDDMPQGDSHWYSLHGTRLNGTPTTPGIYIRNGRKVMVK
jgi:hypothetical protein